MTGAGHIKQIGPGAKRAARLAQALKANMARRKAQAAGRAEPQEAPAMPSEADATQDKTEKGQG